MKEVSQLVSGSLIYRLYEKLITHDYDMDEVTEHLEVLCDTENHFGLLYFVFILTDAVWIVPHMNHKITKTLQQNQTKYPDLAIIELKEVQNYDSNFKIAIN